MLVSEIVDALVAGAATGAAAGGKDAASAAVKDAVTSAYGGLKGLLARRLSGRAATAALAEVESRARDDGAPVEPAVRAELEAGLVSAGAGEDAEVRAATRRLLEALAEVSGDRYVVEAPGAQGMIVGGRNHTIRQTFHGGA